MSVVTDHRGTRTARAWPVTAACRAMLALAVFALGAALPLVPRAFAQSDEVRPLQDRLDRLERDLNLLQRQVYRGKIESGDTDFSSTPPGNAPAQAGGTSNAVADMEVRLNNLEAQLRSVTGSVEEVRHSIDEVRGRLDKLVADVDTRLTAMEQTVAKSKTETGPVAGAEPAPGGANPSAGEPGAPGKGEVALVPPGTAAPDGAGTGAAGESPSTLPQGTPMEQYQFARAQLAKADYPGAEKTLKTFIQNYPDNELTENAEYWLGETYYVRADYRNAAITYADALKKFPKGPKAPDNMLKLGLSFAKMGETCKTEATDECKKVAFADNACTVFSDIGKKYPNARADIRERADAERKQHGCK